MHDSRSAGVLVKIHSDDSPALERGQRLRRRRLEAHLTLQQLAQRAQVTASWLAHVENGIIASPSVDRLTRLCT